MEKSQTSVTEFIKKEVSKVEGENLTFIINLLKYLQKELVKDEEKNLPHRTRTAEEVLKSKKTTGCTDNAHAFISLCEAKGIKAKYVETLSKRWLKEPSKKIEGHIFVKIRLDTELIIDPTYGLINVTGNLENYIPIAEGESFKSIFRDEKEYQNKISEAIKKYGAQKTDTSYEDNNKV